MSDSINPIVIIGIIITLVVLFNFALIARYKNPAKSSDNKAIKSMLNTVRSPWKEEDAALNELANLIKTVQDSPEENDE